MTFRKEKRMVTAASRPALEGLVAYWESREWRRTGRPVVEAAGHRRAAVWSQEMELIETTAGEADAADSIRGGRQAIVWFD